MKPIIEVRHVSKRYKIGAKQEPYLSFRDSISNLRSSLFKKQDKFFWALDDVSFDVMAGECLGIIGGNGAGKSTLLKILSQITPPTKGEIKMRGRVASLLEVGTGFHPELTGRENIYLNGSILGMSRKEILHSFDEIVDFSSIERFLDTPLKHYSSGMQLRLAFSVAAHLNPEILLIDEVLAVGDSEFQKKCLGKMNQVSKSGRTVIFVSHDLAAVKQLCPKGILLDKGKIVSQDNINPLINTYLNSQKAPQDNCVTFQHEEGKEIELVRCQIINGSGKVVPHILFGEDFSIHTDIISHEYSGEYGLTIGIDSQLSQRITTVTNEQKTPKFFIKKKQSTTISASFQGMNLHPGNYSIFLSIRKGRFIFDTQIAYGFLNVDLVSYKNDMVYEGHWGIFRFDPTWTEIL